jgi:hypothetical protein
MNLRKILAGGAAALWLGLAGGAEAQVYWVHGWDRPSAKVRIVNETSRDVDVYATSRWGNWRWVARVKDRDAETYPGAAGQLWIVTDRSGRRLREARIGSGTTELYVGGGRPPGGPAVGAPPQYGIPKSGIRFKNRRDDVIYIYKKDNYGRWIFRSAIGPGRDWEADAAIGRDYFVTDRRGRVLRTAENSPREQTIEIR